jgi:hypothetical protein
MESRILDVPSNANKRYPEFVVGQLGLRSVS